jgi:hypothetical protein
MEKGKLELSENQVAQMKVNLEGFIQSLNNKENQQMKLEGISALDFFKANGLYDAKDDCTCKSEGGGCGCKL